MQIVGPRPWDGQVFLHGPGHPWFFGWFIPLLFLAVLAGLAVWVVLRVTRRPAASAYAWPAPPARFVPDPAVEQARMRYARGELSRDEYLRVHQDLAPGGPQAAPSPEPTPPPSEPDGEPA